MEIDTIRKLVLLVWSLATQVRGDNGSYDGACISVILLSGLARRLSAYQLGAKPTWV